MTTTTNEEKIDYRDIPSSRLRVRRVDESATAADAQKKAKKSGSPSFSVRHGGDVANRYGYPAKTECCVAVALPDGRCVVWVDRIPANKATLAGACSAAPWHLYYLLRAYFDGRVSASTWDLARGFVARAIRAECASVGY